MWCIRIHAKFSAYNPIHTNDVYGLLHKSELFRNKQLSQWCIIQIKMREPCTVVLNTGGTTKDKTTKKQPNTEKHCSLELMSQMSVRETEWYFSGVLPGFSPFRFAFLFFGSVQHWQLRSQLES